MAQRTYVLTLHVVESKIGAVISALSGEATVVSVVPTKESAEAPAPRPAPSGKHRFVGGKHDKGITGKELIMQILDSENRAFFMSEIVTRFMAKGFADTSAYPVTYEAVKNGKARALGEGRYQSAKWPLREMSQIGQAQ